MSKPYNFPIWDGLVAHQQENPISFHVPGHRNGQLFHIDGNSPNAFLNEAQIKYLEALATLACIDVTELAHTDDLHDPSGIIANAQTEAANFFGAEHTFFLVGGSTAGNIATLLALCERGDYVIVQRNVHKSVINGCKLAGVHVVFIAPLLDEETGYSYAPSLHTVEKAVKKYPQAKAVLLTNPNYYGMSIDLAEYSKLVHRYSIPLIVDEAHGAHYGLHPDMPSSALQAGADVVIQSTHKTLPALTMSAMLHIQHARISKERLQQQLAMLESSSPSYLLMASLDLARGLMAQFGQGWIEQSLHYRDCLIKWLIEQKHPLQVEIYGDNNKPFIREDGENSHTIRFDPFRILIYDTTNQLTGFELQQLLARHQIWAEMATLHHVVLVFHVGFTEHEYAHLIKRLKNVSEELIGQEQKALLTNHTTEIIRQSYSNASYYSEGIQISEPVWMDRAVSTDNIVVHLDESINEQSAEMIVPYPPGIPIIYEGEIISSEIVKQIKRLQQAGARFQGSQHINEGKIKILRR